MSNSEEIINNKIEKCDDKLVSDQELEMVTGGNENDGYLIGQHVSVKNSGAFVLCCDVIKEDGLLESTYWFPVGTTRTINLCGDCNKNFRVKIFAWGLFSDPTIVEEEFHSAVSVEYEVKGTLFKPTYTRNVLGRTV